MRKQLMSQLVIVLAVVAILSIGVDANAGPGRGMGYGPGMEYGSGMGPGAGYCPGYGPQAGFGPGRGQGFRGYANNPNLTEEQVKKLDEQRNAFFDATKDLRQDIYAKRLELRSEIAKKTIDSQKALELQKEISKLKADLGQKRIEHLIEMRKINPDAGRGFGGGRGYGRFGGGRGYGRSGGGAGGPCWR